MLGVEGRWDDGGGGNAVENGRAKRRSRVAIVDEGRGRRIFLFLSLFFPRGRWGLMVERRVGSEYWKR